MGSFYGREPAVILGLIQATFALAMSFGLNLTDEQLGSILAFTGLLIAVITRQSVVSPGTLRQAGTSAKEVEAVAAHPTDTLTRTGTGDGRVSSTPKLRAWLILAVLASVFSMACASNPPPDTPDAVPEYKVALQANRVMDIGLAAQEQVIALGKGGIIPPDVEIPIQRGFVRMGQTAQQLEGFLYAIEKVRAAGGVPTAKDLESALAAANALTPIINEVIAQLPPAAAKIVKLLQEAIQTVASILDFLNVLKPPAPVPALAGGVL